MRLFGRLGSKAGTGLVAALVPAVLAASLILTNTTPVRALRDLVFDSYQRLLPRPYDPTAPVRVVAIDEDSLARVGQWPWPRETLATLVERLGEAGAAAIALDMIIAEPERGRDTAGEAEAAGDDRLAQNLEKYRVVLGQALGNQSGAPIVKAGVSFAGDDPLRFVPAFHGAVVPLPRLAAVAQGIGALNWTPDRDLVVRRVPLVFNGDGRLVPSFAVEALRAAQGAAGLVVKSSNASMETAFGHASGIVAIRIGALQADTEGDGSLLIRYAGSQDERHIPAWRVLDGSADLSAVNGSIVLVGASAAAMSDVRATPLQGAVAGVDVHAEIVEHILAGARLSRPDYGPGLETLAVVFGCLLVGFLAVVLRPLPAALTTLALLALVAGLSWLAFTRLELLVDPAVPILGMATTFATATAAALRRSDRDKRQIRDAFGRYLSPAIVEVLAEDPAKLKLGGELRPITVLFSDIRGFTARSEQLDAEEVLSFLNAVHAPMTEEVLRSGGTLDKFIGDGLMAFWNAPVDVPDHVRACLRCALAMQRALVSIDQGLARDDAAAGRPHTPVAIGIGIHTGMACVGNVGSVRRFDYSAIGDAVNTAARIEQTSKMYGVPIIVSEDVTQAAGDFAYVPIDEAQLRGRVKATRLYALLGDASAADEDFRAFRDLHEDAFAAYLSASADSDERIAACEQHPLGRRFATLYRLYRERIAVRRAKDELVSDAY